MASRVSKSDLQDLIDWLKSNPAGRIYDYGSITSCLLATYLRDAGHQNVIMMSSVFSSNKTEGENWPIPWPVDEISRDAPHTYGEALRRAQNFMHELYPE